MQNLRINATQSLRGLVLVALVLTLAACGQNRSPDAGDDLTTNAAEGEYTVEATGSNVTHVVWSLDGEQVATSEEAPYSLTLDLAQLEPGDHQIHALITIDVLEETSDVERTVSFTVADDSDPEDEGGASWTLVNADTDEDIAPIGSGSTLYAENPQDLSARLADVPGSVTFYLDGDRTRRENSEPYALFGDNKGDYHGGDLSGEHTLRGVDGDGNEHIVTFTVEQGDPSNNDGSGDDGTDDGSDGGTDDGSDDGSDGDDSGDVPTVPEGDDVPRLLAGWGWEKDGTIQIDDFFYEPNYVEGGEFDGYDRLFTRSVDSRSFQFHLELTREATVVMAWPSDSPKPDWTPEWEVGPTVELDDGSYDTFVNVLPEGKQLLRDFDMLGDTPTFLIGEADGSASAYPEAPTGYEQPQPNERCPEWVHDQYTVTEDGETFRGWHPPLDPVYACKFEHEHGSDPAEFAGDWEPRFDRYAGMPTPDGGTLGHEGHAGFKVFVTAPHDGVQMMATLHANSSGQRRVCTRYHATDMVFADPGDGDVLANLSYKGDFGFPRITGGGPRLDPQSCPEATSVGDSDGRRSFKGPDVGKGYEPWLQGIDTAAALPLGGSSIMWSLDNPQTKCADEEHCDEVILVGEDEAFGTRRWFDLLSFHVDATSGSWGTFCTDVYGTARLDCGDPGAVEQYVQEGFSWTPERARFSVDEPFDAVYQPQTSLGVTNMLTNINGNVPIGGSN